MRKATGRSEPTLRKYGAFPSKHKKVSSTSSRQHSALLGESATSVGEPANLPPMRGRKINTKEVEDTCKWALDVLSKDNLSSAFDNMNDVGYKIFYNDPVTTVNITPSYEMDIEMDIERIVWPPNKELRICMDSPYDGDFVVSLSKSLEEVYEEDTESHK